MASSTEVVAFTEKRQKERHKKKLEDNAWCVGRQCPSKIQNHLEPPNVPLFRNSVFSDVISYNVSYWIRVGSKSYNCCSRRSCEETERRPCDNRVRDQSDASSSQGTLRIANHQELERQGADSPLELSEGDNLTDTITLNFWPPNWERRNVCCFKPLVFGNLLQCS